MSPREAADRILADDNFATVTEAVRTGRVLYANLRKSVRYYLAAKVALVFSSLVAVLLKLPVPFEPVQIIVMELLFMSSGGLSLGAAVLVGYLGSTYLGSVLPTSTILAPTYDCG